MQFLPLPVLILGTYDKDGKANAMNAAWGTVCDTAQVSICLDKNHKTVKTQCKHTRPSPMHSSPLLSQSSLIPFSQKEHIAP